MSDDDPKIDLDLDAWAPQLPSADFAEKVLAKVREEHADANAGANANANANTNTKTKTNPSARTGTGTGTGERGRARRWGLGVGVAGVLALAAAMALRVTAPDAHGEAIAKERLEVSIGSRARAVLEPGAQLKWDGDDVVQDHGDVFYRVEPGARFRVHTPAGDVEVKGTCFAVKVRGEGVTNGLGSKSEEGTDMNKRDVKSGVIGAALSALAFVAVYEGKVAVSHASERVDLGAGETAQSGAGGVHRTGGLGAGEKKFDDNVAEASAGDGLSKANENLASQVSDYRRRLEAIAAQKSELEQTLKNTEQKLAAHSDGSAPRSKAQFDLGPEDWKELAKDGTIKYMKPCVRAAGWSPSPDQLQQLALAPQDGPVLQGAYVKSNQRLWAVIRPLCAQEVGSVEVADKIGPDTCIHLVLDASKDKDAAHEAMRQVGEVRAGMRQGPGPAEQNNPVGKMFLALTGELKLFENDLAQTLGPEEAHRVAYADGMCMGQSTFGGAGPRGEPAKK